MLEYEEWTQKCSNSSFSYKFWNGSRDCGNITSMKKVVTIGGGGGHSQVLKGIKNIKDIEVTAICPSTDSGGSTGVLQKEYGGTGHIGDLTKCLIALCDDKSLTDSLMYRYDGGPLDGHSVKNLLFHSLEKTSGLGIAIETMRKICGLNHHKIFPVTTSKTELCATLKVGNTIRGETNIDTIAKNPLWTPDSHAIDSIFLKPPVDASDVVINSIKDSDYLIVCPGDLYSSIIPVLLPKGIKEAVQNSNTKIIVFVNIMTKMGETDNYTVTDFINKIEEYLGRKSDFVIYNNAPIDKNILAKYSMERKVELSPSDGISNLNLIPVPIALVLENEQIVSDPEIIKETFCKILEGNL